MLEEEIHYTAGFGREDASINIPEVPKLEIRSHQPGPTGVKKDVYKTANANRPTPPPAPSQPKK